MTKRTVAQCQAFTTLFADGCGEAAIDADGNVYLVDELGGHERLRVPAKVWLQLMGLGLIVVDDQQMLRINK